jgi:hypothetical protein
MTFGHAAGNLEDGIAPSHQRLRQAVAVEARALDTPREIGELVDEHGDDLFVMNTGYGIYRISGMHNAGFLHVRPLITITQFAPFPPSAFPSNVTVDSAP